MSPLHTYRYGMRQGEPFYLHTYYRIPYGFSVGGGEAPPPPPYTPTLEEIHEFVGLAKFFRKWRPECTREDCIVCPQTCVDAALAGREFLRLIEERSGKQHD